MANNSDYLLGQETELAIRFRPTEYGEHPGNKVIFDTFYQVIQSLVKTKPGKRNFIQDQFFVQNGGAMYYEHHPQSLRKGLIESATPECHSAHELVLYQRAGERLLTKAMPTVTKRLSDMGYEGELSLIKNSRDYEGNTYGSQENYDSFLADTRELWLLRVILISLIPLAIGFKIFYLLSLIPFVFFVFVTKLFLETILVFMSGGLLKRFINKFVSVNTLRSLFRQSAQRLTFETDDTEEFLLKLEYAIFYPLFWISYKPLILVYNRFAFRRQREQLHGHIVSRIIYTGAGSLLKEGHFVFSEKSVAINHFQRSTIHRNDKPLFDCGNLIKEFELAIWEMFLFRFGSWKSLLSRDHRLQVAFSDSNRSHLSEFLKIGVTSLLVRMANENYLTDAPRMKNPVDALQIITRDVGLSQTVELANGEPMTAIQIQNWYLQKAKEFLKEKTVGIEDHEVVRLWEEVLKTLSHDPEKLIGRIDWVTKKYLLQTSGEGLDYWDLKKIDLKYHELGTGYFDQLQENKMTLDIFTDDDVETAVYEPSSPNRVKIRSRLIRSIAFSDKPMTISWSQAKIGRWKPKVISLEDYRENRDDHIV